MRKSNIIIPLLIILFSCLLLFSCDSGKSKYEGTFESNYLFFDIPEDIIQELNMSKHELVLRYKLKISDSIIEMISESFELFRWT